jgi:hypothetical protein
LLHSGCRDEEIIDWNKDTVINKLNIRIFFYHF